MQKNEFTQIDRTLLIGTLTYALINLLISGCFYFCPSDLTPPLPLFWSLLWSVILGPPGAIVVIIATLMVCGFNNLDYPNSAVLWLVVAVSLMISFIDLPNVWKIGLARWGFVYRIC